MTQCGKNNQELKNGNKMWLGILFPERYILGTHFEANS